MECPCVGIVMVTYQLDQVVFILVLQTVKASACSNPQMVRAGPGVSGSLPGGGVLTFDTNVTGPSRMFVKPSNGKKLALDGGWWRLTPRWE